MNYIKQATEFCERNGIGVRRVYLKTDYHFDDDKQKRDIFFVEITNTKTKQKMDFNFGDSIFNTEKRLNNRSNLPSVYSILACLEKYDVGTFEDFCSEYGYDVNSRKAEKIHKAVLKEWQDVERVFSNCLDELREI